MIQGFADEKVRIPRIPLIFRPNFGVSFFETDFLHVKVLIVPPPALPDGPSELPLQSTQATAKTPLYKEPIVRVWSIGSQPQHRGRSVVRQSGNCGPSAAHRQVVEGRPRPSVILRK
jgi:hypothetical protein